MDLKVIQPTKSTVHEVDMKLLKDKPYEAKQIKIPKVELSENIQAFDKKPRVYTKNPFDFNSVSLKKREENIVSRSAEAMITDPLYNTAGKVLGVDTIHDWNRYYDKVNAIVDWAKKETNLEGEQLIQWIYEQSQKANRLGSNKIDDVYIYAKFYRPSKPEVVVKEVLVKEKLTTEEMVDRIIQG